MKAVLAILPSVVITIVLALACAPWGAPDEARFVMPLLPYMAAHVFLARGVGVLPLIEMEPALGIGLAVYRVYRGRTGDLVVWCIAARPAAPVGREINAAAINIKNAIKKARMNHSPSRWPNANQR